MTTPHSNAPLKAVIVVLLSIFIFSEANNLNTKNSTEKVAKNQTAIRRSFDIEELGGQHDKRSTGGLLGLAAPLLALGGGADGILKSLFGLGLGLSGMSQNYEGARYSTEPEPHHILPQESSTYNQAAYPGQVTQVSINPLDILQTLATKGAILGSALNALKGVILGGSQFLADAVGQSKPEYKVPNPIMGHYDIPQGALYKGDVGQRGIYETIGNNAGYESLRRPTVYSPMPSHYIDGPLQVPASQHFRHPFSGFDEGNEASLKRPPTYDDHLELLHYRGRYNNHYQERRPKGNTDIVSDDGGTNYPQKNAYNSEEDVAQHKGKAIKATSHRGNKNTVTASPAVENSQIGKSLQQYAKQSSIRSKGKSEAYKIPVKEYSDNDINKSGHDKHGAYQFGTLEYSGNKGTGTEDTTSYARRANMDPTHNAEHYDVSIGNPFIAHHNNGPSDIPNYYGSLENSHFYRPLYSPF